MGNIGTKSLQKGLTDTIRSIRLPMGRNEEKRKFKYSSFSTYGEKEELIILNIFLFHPNI